MRPKDRASNLKSGAAQGPRRMKLGGDHAFDFLDEILEVEGF